MCPRLLVRLGAAVLVTAAIVFAAAIRWNFRGTEAATEVRGVTLARGIETVAPGVHLLGRGFPAAAYLVETSDGLVLVDTCTEPDATPILDQVAELGLDVRRLRAILLTHCHADHTMGAERLRALTGARVYAGRGDCEPLADGTSRDALYSVFDMDVHPHRTDVDVPLDGGEVISVGDTSVRALATPGHTPGSTCYLLERDGLRILFTGDVVMSLTDADALAGPGIYAAYLAPAYRGNARDFAASLRTLRAMPAPDLVLPGHPAADGVPQSPHPTPERWEAMLTRAIDRLDALTRRYRNDGDDFLDGVPKTLLPGLHYWGDLDGRAVYALVTPSRRLVVVDAPGGDELPRLVARRRVSFGLGDVRPSAVLLTSCGPAATAGLSSLVEDVRCLVIAPRSGLDTVRRLCPADTQFCAADAVGSLGWFAADVVPVEGTPVPAAAYAIRWEGRNVLFTPSLPTRTELDSGVPVSPVLPEGGVRLDSYADCLGAFAALAPDLWLPAVPVCRQNANLYAGDWARVVASNRSLCR